ncbi:MAG TPA: radical SAM family heme chaperone HemW [Terriglobales bacterium]|nr:radical SAM family heme chaperone HemW [Terriglobales bacterium]
MPLGLYVSVPFCKTKCSYCNFASDVFSGERFRAYVQGVCAEIARAEQTAEEMGGRFERDVDSIYFGGGTPSLLPPDLLEHVFDAVRKHFAVARDAEITVECAPGTLMPEMIGALVRLGVNRVSLGVQSFVDGEAAAVGRRHTRAIVLDDIARLREAGIANLNLDLIAGLPHQTAESWRSSLDDAIATGVPHVSVYMLEVDEDSRLGRELIAGGTRYHAHFVPDEDAVADFYTLACEELEGAGIRQYEISNFARAGAESRHNLKYWTRQPYLGFGVDAHSMLPAGPSLSDAGVDAIRFRTPWDLEEFLKWDGEAPCDLISRSSALEETFFLGLRLNCGVELAEAASKFGQEEVQELDDKIADLLRDGLVRLHQGSLFLTPRGRLLSNEVFERFVSIGTVEDLPDILGLDPDDPRRARIAARVKVQ